MAIDNFINNLVRKFQNQQKSTLLNQRNAFFSINNVCRSKGNKFIINNKVRSADQYLPSSGSNCLTTMLNDFSQTKIYKSKTQPSESAEQPSNQAPEPFVNPIIKHTLDSLPIIYGNNINRKRKYNVFMKSKFQLNNIISKAHDKNYLPNQRLYRRINSLEQQQRFRGHSCLQMSSNKKSDQREQITRTVTKKNKKLFTSPNDLTSSQQKMHQALVTPKNKRIVNLQAVHSLSKPKEKCNNQYCSCKSLYDEYQEEINKKLKQKSQSSANKKQSGLKVHLPRLSAQSAHKSSKKLDDQQSKHKVGFRYKINSLDKQKQQQGDGCCQLCKKQKIQVENGQSKGILGLIKKKQLEEKRKKLSHYSKTQSIGIQMGENQSSQAQAGQNEDFGIQADLITAQKKLKTIDQQINTDFDDQNNPFKYLQNHTNLKQPNPKNSKKQPMQHLSHLKEKYKYQKRPSYQFKYGPDELEKEEDGPQNQRHEQQNHSNPDLKLNSKKKRHKNTVRGSKDDSEDFDMDMSIESGISENSMMNHLADALAANGKDKSTIFKMLKKKEQQQSEKQIQLSNLKRKRPTKSKKEHKYMNLIDTQTGLFSIPEEQQYVDYLKSYQPIQKDFKIKNLIKSQNFKIIKYKDTLYFGQAESDNTKHGKALFISPKQIFQGVYENGVKMSGCERNIDGVYMGEFLNGLRHGEGKWIWNNGQIYEGQWKLGTKNGFGVWKSPKGDSYEGQWVMNRQQGKGVHRHKNSVYEGQFVQALKEGHGREKYINGDQYIGQYYKGKPHGQGKYIWKNGTYYEGQFTDGLRQGYGKQIYSDKAYYEGQFRNDFKHGNGKQNFLNGDKYDGEYFEGEKVNGVMTSINGKITEIMNDKINKKRQQKVKEKQMQNSRISHIPERQTKNQQQQQPLKKLEKIQVNSSLKQPDEGKKDTNRLNNQQEDCMMDAKSELN